MILHYATKKTNNKRMSSVLISCLLVCFCPIAVFMVTVAVSFDASEDCHGDFNPIYMYNPKGTQTRPLLLFLYFLKANKNVSCPFLLTIASLLIVTEKVLPPCI